ncbi:MAG: hypothetical protein HeimC3_49860 [Candidatus Heimdallarchaeota archaeon LC_3]|nr:MAG: hypothetical protein HeimC3_49860 [Candidatus Heimdallarchaeota archaeon LC_3]
MSQSCPSCGVFLENETEKKCLNCGFEDLSSKRLSWKDWVPSIILFIVVVIGVFGLLALLGIGSSSCMEC